MKRALIWILPVFIFASLAYFLWVKIRRPAPETGGAISSESSVSLSNLNRFLADDFPALLQAKGLQVEIDSTEGSDYGSEGLTYAFPRGYSRLWVRDLVSSALDSAGFIAEFRRAENDSGDLVLDVGTGTRISFRMKLRGSRVISKGLVSIIVDDFGYTMNKWSRDVLDLDVPLAVSVIPGHEYSKAAAVEARLKGKEVLIHLPMEPYGYERGEEDFIILIGMSEGEVLRRVGRAISEIPGAAGVNNHQGSLATSDGILMQRVLEVVSLADLYFIDSFTHAGSVAESKAREMGIRTERRRVFLDDAEDFMTVKDRMEVLRRIVEKEGYAIGIGHATEETVETLKKEIPLLLSEGYEFVYPSQIVR